MDLDVTVVGAGIVGLAIASRLAERNHRVAVVERHRRYGLETSSRNSEVVHAGIYYPSHWLKTTLCLEGNRLLRELAERGLIPVVWTGKLVVARSADEAKALEVLYHRGQENGVPLQWREGRDVSEAEPAVRACAGIFSPTTGMTNAHALMDYFARAAEDAGATVALGAAVTALEPDRSGITFRLADGDSLTTRFLINATGLSADRLAALAGIDVEAQGEVLQYCKGDYFAAPGKVALGRLVYPVPDEVSLGIHATPRLMLHDGRLQLQKGIRLGPSAYYIPRVEADALDYAVDENRREEFAAARTFIPSLEPDDLTPDMAGVRPRLQAAGEAARDFIIRPEAEVTGLINLIGIDSPGLTAAPGIARYVADLIQELDA